MRSERAMILARAEMDVQGISTRKETAIVEELCGLEVTSTRGGTSRSARSPTSCLMPTRRKSATMG
jgi:transposase-like protein